MASKTTTIMTPRSQPSRPGQLGSSTPWMHMLEGTSFSKHVSSRGSNSPRLLSHSELRICSVAAVSMGEGGGFRSTDELRTLLRVLLRSLVVIFSADQSVVVLARLLTACDRAGSSNISLIESMFGSSEGREERWLSRGACAVVEAQLERCLDRVPARSVDTSNLTCPIFTPLPPSSRSSDVLSMALPPAQSSPSHPSLVVLVCRPLASRQARLPIWDAASLSVSCSWPWPRPQPFCAAACCWRMAIASGSISPRKMSRCVLTTASLTRCASRLTVPRA
mmetsp:Transcript_33665/g.86163  ORF Transcript_33665/g.86163 Transcript_33665/m.86163 type:complete len:279 (-) Transcript_33665:280-1116(-)